MIPTSPGPRVRPVCYVRPYTREGKNMCVGRHGVLKTPVHNVHGVHVFTNRAPYNIPNSQDIHPFHIRARYRRFSS